MDMHNKSRKLGATALLAVLGRSVSACSTAGAVVGDAID
jgi:hypothetical protein